MILQCLDPLGDCYEQVLTFEDYYKYSQSVRDEDKKKGVQSGGAVGVKDLKMKNLSRKVCQS